MTDEESGAGARRYAIYFAPPRGSAWWRFGAHWLGRDDAAEGPLRQSAPPAGITPEDWDSMTLEPRRYGYHATLKAPFRLAAHAAVPELHERMARLAGELRAIPLVELRPHAFAGFVALVPAAEPPGLNELAARCVLALDDLRAALLDTDIARRQPERLDARGRELLLLHGYPHVLERFRFHMTLAMCSGAAAAHVVHAASRTVEPLCRRHPPVLDRLCLFEEPRPGAAFRRVRDFELRR